MLSNRKIALAVLLPLATLVVGVAAAEKPVTVVVGNLRLAFNGGLTPKALPRTRPVPVTFSGSGLITTTDGSHPPALEEFILETDRNAFLDISGVPTCRAARLQAQDSAHARAACHRSIIGTGTGKVEIAFPEQAPIRATSPLTIFNGGERGGVATLYVHIYVSVPAPAAVVTTVRISRIHHGRYGLRSVAVVPRIAGGSGSATFFSFTINRSLDVDGKRLSVLRARCPDGHLQAHGAVRFSNSVRAAADVLRRCVGRP